MASIVQYSLFVVLVASCFAAPGHTGQRERRHYDGGVGGFGYPAFGGRPGGHGFDSFQGGHFGGSQSFSKSSATASSSSQGGSGHIHG